MTFQRTATAFLACASLLLLESQARAQGCVAIRQFSCGGGNSQAAAILHDGEMQVGANYRYFRSFRHFKGSEEQTERLVNNTEVINYSHALDINVSYGLMERLYLTATIPLVYNERSSLYEYGGKERLSSFSSGLADMRVGAGYWLLSEKDHPKQNVALGLGVKIPTGNYAATDFFPHVGADSAGETRSVDQSIQPGDGGWGVALDFQGYQNIVGDLSLYASGFYLINPRETNGTRTYRETINPILANETIMSVPDQYAVRAGLNYSLPEAGLGMSLGARLEGVPVEDLVGGSEGFRRPGSVLSVEPGVSYLNGGLGFNLSVPFALARKRPQSVTDRETELRTGIPRNGDAAFADYLINFGMTYRFHLSGMD